MISTKVSLRLKLLEDFLIAHTPDVDYGESHFTVVSHNDRFEGLTFDVTCEECGETS